VRVAARKAELGGAAQPGQAVLTYTGVSRVVSLKLTIGKARLARRDAPVSVTLPDGRHTPGTVTRVATVVDQDQKGGQDSTRIEVMISVADQAALAGYDEAAVQVGFSAEERQDVLTVPVAALLALAEGGYGLQVVENGSTRILPVQTGLFSGGQVEVRGEGLSAGTTVGMPK
jgi:hypothetical protein